jgi:hypothetical protein
MQFDADILVELLEDAWSRGKCVAHNWQSNPFGAQAESIWQWCDAHKIDWGAPQGYLVQNAQRAELPRADSRIAAFQQDGGHRKIMFSLSAAKNPAAYAAASQLAKAHGFRPV